MSKDVITGLPNLLMSWRMDCSGRIYDLKSLVDSFAEAPRAIPFGLARLPKIYLQERYQLVQVSKALKNQLLSFHFIADLELITLSNFRGSPSFSACFGPPTGG